MPDPITAAYDPADQSDRQALVDQLLASPAFQEAVRGLVQTAAGSIDAGESEPYCHMAACPPANEGFPEIRQYAVQPFAWNPGDAATCHAPLIMPPDNSLHATFTGMTTPMPYSTTDGQIYMFPGTVNGVEVYGFCVDHALPAPIGSFGNISIDVALNGQSQTTKLAVAFVIANVPRLPTDDAVQFFEMLGLPCAAGFNGYDARAVGRYVIYALLGQLSGGLAGLQFIDRAGYPPIGAAKADCLKQACQILFEMALAFGSGTLDCGPGGGPGAGGGSAGNAACCNCVSSSNYTCGGSSCAATDNCCCSDPCGLRLGCQLGKIYCCNTNQAVTDNSDTYLVFVGCANDLRECCGRVVVGPFKLASSNRGVPDIKLVPCNGCVGADIQITDFCCNILAAPPAIGDEFYIAFRPPCCRYCFDLCATMETTSVAVYFFREAGNAAVQRQGLSFPRTDIRTTCIHVCIDITPETPPPEPEPWWEHILVNNNNNNNNNDSNSANNDNNSNNMMNSLLNTLLSNLLSSSMMGGMQGGQLGGNIGGMMGMPGMGPMPPGLGPFPPGPPGPFPPGPGPGGGPPCDDGRFPFPWGLFPPGTTPCPPPACGGPNPCCCPPPCPPCPQPCCCPPPCPPACWCPPPCPPCPPVCMPWPCPCPEPCFCPPPFPYIPEPNLIIQPTSLTYQVMPVPCFCPQPMPYPQPVPYAQPMPVFPPQWQPPVQPVPFMPFQEDSFDFDPAPSAMPVSMPDPAYWPQYSTPWTPPVSAGFYPPEPEPMPLLLPEFSSAPRPDFSPFEVDDDDGPSLYDQFYRDWYGQ